MTAQQRHQDKVLGIAQQIRHQVSRGQQVHITRKSGHHVVPLPDDPRFRNEPVDISCLDQVLEVDTEARRCVVEPGVSFRDLVRQTLPHGLIPTVVPELEGITVGGAVAGCSIEAMSYRHGGFHDSCLEYEVITGDGEVMTCSPRQEPLTFEMLHGSYGTLGILSKVTCKLVPAQPYVRLEYRHMHSFELFERELRQRCREADFDFIDGIIHGPRHFVVCLGRFVATAPQVSDYRHLEIYYKSTATLNTDYLTTADYCFRYDTECHWLTRTIPPLEWRAVRWAAGRHFLGSTKLIAWSNRLSRLNALKRRPEVVCDVFIPAGNFEAFWRWYERDFDFYPLWIVPYRIPGIYPWVNAAYGERMADAIEDSLIIDCAVYGKPNSDPARDFSELLEQKTHELCGIKTLISRNHYTRDSFWSVYNEANYRQVKQRLDPVGTLPDLFETFGKVG